MWYPPFCKTYLSENYETLQQNNVNDLTSYEHYTIPTYSRQITTEEIAPFASYVFVQSAPERFANSNVLEILLEVLRRTIL